MLVFAIVLQAAGSIWWAATTNTTIKDQERRIKWLEDRDDTRNHTDATMGATLAALDATMKSVQDAVTQLTNRLNK